jgi:hypothetical protein
VGDTVPVAGRTITVTELDGRRIARLRVTANVPAPSGQPPSGQPPSGQAPSGQAPSGQAQPGVPPATNGVSAGQVLLDSEAPHE